MVTQKKSTPDIPEARRDMTPKKGGRPKKAEEEKKKGVSVYFTDKEKAKITKDAKSKDQFSCQEAFQAHWHRQDQASARLS